jgi:hypothetical protein
MRIFSLQSPQSFHLHFRLLPDSFSHPAPRLFLSQDVRPLSFSKQRAAH